jgi:signal transduction histidine kinase/CheY-like chemotaxis protein
VEVFHIRNEETRHPVESPVIRVLREGNVVGLANHTVLLARDGTELPIADSGAPIRDPDGAISGVVLVFRDQTEERRTEEMRNNSLRLEADNARIQEASRLKSEFLANMSHELRTPLNAIIGFAELIHDGDVRPDMPEYAEFVGDILTSGRHLLQLINDVLDLSKVEAGKLQFHTEPVDLSALIGEVLGILRTSIASKGIRITSRVDVGVTDVVLDAARFKQVLYNYVSNAIKFTPENGRISVRVQPDEGGPAAFRLEVEDTGIGIAPEDIGRLFVEFQQLDAGAAKQHSGTGLGLALTKRLVEAQGGTVGVRSTLGMGSTFYAIFPRQATIGAPMPEPRSVPGLHIGAPTVLVIEDNAHDQATLVRTLVEAGYSVETAATGAQALARCRERTFDAITLDLLLPDMSGLDVLRAIRSDDGSYNSNINHSNDHRKNSDVPVIVITVVTEHGAVAGFAVHDLLAKPIDSTMLLASLARADISREQSGTILVVDDDLGSRRLMAATLDQLGYRSNCVPNGDGGLRMAQEAAPLAVVLDLLMPGMDGFEFLERFRQLPLCRCVPVLIWTVKDLSTNEYARLRTSAQGVISKGHDDRNTILEELRNFLPVAPVQTGGVDASG